MFPFSYVNCWFYDVVVFKASHFNFTLERPLHTGGVLFCLINLHVSIFFQTVMNIFKTKRKYYLVKKRFNFFYRKKVDFF